eukprot:CAMPEP_0119003944 /NCGR_PEP_ID=MMETSP1176-20130426/857_1 /TAXON_ID=265551 /ORGANISM="Synedropsis recta cf, Strain CCMP1620" /LENGTH=206 /DNA_ID=CAMNT_0006955595 /DNA_START=28 /DNA_END=648 /DNA_ORIENTATION=+
MHLFASNKGNNTCFCPIITSLSLPTSNISEHVALVEATQDSTAAAAAASKIVSVSPSSSGKQHQQEKGSNCILDFGMVSPEQTLYDHASWKLQESEVVADAVLNKQDIADMIVWRLGGENNTTNLLVMLHDDGSRVNNVDAELANHTTRSSSSDGLIIKPGSDTVLAKTETRSTKFEFTGMQLLLEKQLLLFRKIGTPTAKPTTPS